MKQLLLCVALFATLSVNAQAKKDSLVKPQLTDSTALISIKDYNELDKILAEMPTKYANQIYSWFNQKFQEKMEAWRRKNK